MADQVDGGSNEAREARLRERELLSEASAVLSSSLDVNETVSELVRLLVPRLVDWASVRIAKEDGTPELVALAHADPERLARGRELEARFPASPSEQSAVNEVLRTGRSIFLPRISEEMLVESARSPEYLEHTLALGMISGMFVALKARGRTFGALVLCTDASSGRALDEDDLALMEEIAARAALAIDNARLFAEVERSAKAVEQAAERVRILAEASSALAAALDDETALEMLAEIVTRSLADWAITYAYREQDQTIRRVGFAHRDVSKRALVEALVSAGEPSLSDAWGVGAVIREGKSFFVSEIERDSDVRCAQNEEHARLLIQLSPRSSIIVPLAARGRIIGALTLAATDASGRRYTPDDLVLVEKLASDAALLVDNARLLRQAQEAVRARDDMVAAVSHDLRSPLQVIRNGVAFLEAGRGTSDTRALTIRAIAQCTEQMERFVVGLLDVARLEDGAYPLAKARVDARALLAEAVSILAPLAQEKEIDMTIDGPEEPAIVDADPDAIRRALGNVIGNAVKFAPVRGRVRAEVAREGEVVRFRVEDSGPGIAESELPLLFDRFFRTRRARGHGTGLGLAIAKGLVDAHGGEIRVASTVGRGSTFEILLPAVP